MRLPDNRARIAQELRSRYLALHDEMLTEPPAARQAVLARQEEQIMRGLRACGYTSPYEVPS